MDSSTESLDLITQREKIQQQILALEKYFDAEEHSGMSSCSSVAEGDESDDDEDAFDTESGLDAKHEKIQREIRELEETLGLGAEEDLLSDKADSPENPNSEYSDDEDLDLPQNPETCLEMNQVYQEVLREKLSELEQLLLDNLQQQREIESQVDVPAGPNQPALPSMRMFIGNFMKPYFRDKVTGLGPPANQETKDRQLSGTNPCDEKKIKRWEGWQKSLLISGVVQDTMKRLLQPKLSKMEYLRDKASKAKETEKEALQKQIQDLDVEIAKISDLGEEDLMGNRNDDHDWDKIANIDFEGKRDAEDLKQFWQNYLHPSINKSSWKPEEIEKLKSIVEQNQGSNWETIADKMETNRTAFMCFQAHQRYIYKSFKKRAWTSLEDNQLRDLVKKRRIGNFIPYTQISYFMDGRDASQCMYRWSQVLDPSIKKGAWSKDEDAMLLRAVQKHGIPNWWRIRYEVPGRTDAQCRDRYLDCLSKDIKKGPWTLEEQALLREAVQKHGVGKWAKIASEIPGRVDSQCLTKWRLMTKFYQKQKEAVRTSSSVIKGPSSSAGKQVKKTAVKKKRPKRSKMAKKKSQKAQCSDEEIEYLDSDSEKDHSEEEPEEPEEEPEIIVPKYVQPPFCEWIPRQTAGVLRIALVKHPKDLTPRTSQNGFVIPHVHYTVLDRSGHLVERFKAQEYEIPKKRTYEEDMILVREVDVRTLYEMFGARILKTTQKERPKAAQGHSKRPNRGTNAVGTRGAVKLQKAVQATSNELMTVVSGWMGNILIHMPSSLNQKFEVDVVRQRAAKVELSSTAVFLAFLKLLHIDSTGCKNVISARTNQGLSGMHHSPAQLMMCNMNMGKKRSSEALKRSRMKQQQPQQAPSQLQQPQQTQHCQSMSAQSSQNVAQETQPHIAQQLQPFQSQTGFAQMPKLPLPRRVQVAQPFLMSLIPPQSTCNTTVSIEKPTRQRKRTRKPSAKVKEAMKETKAKNESRCKKPRLENTLNTVSPVTWIIAPSAQTPLNTQDPNRLIVNNMLSLPPAATGLTLPSPPTSTNNTSQTNIPLNLPAVLPSTVVFSLPDAQGRGPIMMVPVVNIPNLVTANMASIPVTTPSTSVPGGSASAPSTALTTASSTALTTASTSVTGGCSAPSPATPCFTISPLGSSAPLPHNSLSTASCSNGPSPAALAQSSTGSPRPVNGALPLTTAPVGTLTPSGNQSQTPLQDTAGFDPNLMFLEDPGTVKDWMSGRSGIVAPQLDQRQPYLPPFVSSVNSLQSLLKAKKSLLEHSLRILPARESTYFGQMEEDDVADVRRRVAERFSCNPAYLSLKTRFLSCFTVPAFLATINPRTDPPDDPPDDQESEDV